MPNDLVDFWAAIEPAACIHPNDREVFSRVADHGFSLDVLPGCFMGPLSTAPIVLLYLSPGLSDEDEPTDTRVEWHAKQRSGTARLPSQEEHKSANTWWSSRTKCFGSDVTFDLLSDQVAVLNIAAYHSKDFKDWGLLSALPSSRKSLDWAQRFLFPAAISGERTVICLRAARYWGLTPCNKYGQALFAPEVTRGGHMKNGRLREEAVAAVRARLGLN